MLNLGVIDAAVNGGTAKYKEAFFTEEFARKATEKQIQLIPVLKAELVKQTEILAKGLKVHSKVMPENMAKLQEQLENICAVMKTDTASLVPKE